MSDTTTLYLNRSLNVKEQIETVSLLDTCYSTLLSTKKQSNKPSYNGLRYVVGIEWLLGMVFLNSLHIFIFLNKVNKSCLIPFWE